MRAQSCVSRAGLPLLTTQPTPCQFKTMAPVCGLAKVQVVVAHLRMTSRTPRNSPSRVPRAAVTTAIPSPDVMAMLARFRIILQSTRQHYQAVEQLLGIGGSQLQALAIIAEQPHVGVSALARALLIRQPTASNLVEQLVKLDLVHRRKSAVDQRAIELSVTPKARRILAKAPGPIVGILADALASLSPAALKQLGTSLDALLRAMKSRDESARFRPLADM